MNMQTLIYADQLIQFTTKLSSDKIFGLGEHRSPFLLSTHWTKFTLWNHDNIPLEDVSLLKNIKTYVLYFFLLFRRIYMVHIHFS